MLVAPVFQVMNSDFLFASRFFTLIAQHQKLNSITLPIERVIIIASHLLLHLVQKLINPWIRLLKGFLICCIEYKDHRWTPPIVQLIQTPVDLLARGIPNLKGNQLWWIPNSLLFLVKIHSDGCFALTFEVSLAIPLNNWWFTHTSWSQDHYFNLSLLFNYNKQQFKIKEVVNYNYYKHLRKWKMNEYMSCWIAQYSWVKLTFRRSGWMKHQWACFYLSFYS